MGEYELAQKESQEFYHPPEELHSEEDLTQFWLTYNRNNGLELGDARRELLAATFRAKQTLKEIEEKDDNSHFFGIKSNGKMISTGKLEIWRDDKQTKRGYLSLLTVDEEHRGKDIAKTMTDKRVERAKELGCTWVDTKVFTGNPTALATKFNDGYILSHIEFQEDSAESGGFVLSKKINTKEDEEKDFDQYQEIALTDLAGIDNLLSQEWRGIDVKNSGDSKDNDPEQWKLIMAKKTNT